MARAEPVTIWQIWRGQYRREAESWPQIIDLVIDPQREAAERPKPKRLSRDILDQVVRLQGFWRFDS